MCLVALLLIVGSAAAKTIHEKTNECQLGTLQDENACMETCLTCHPSSSSSLGDMDIHQIWNIGQLTVDEIVSAEALAKLLQSEADKAAQLDNDIWADLPFQHLMCRDCHDARGVIEDNHPWRIAYPQSTKYAGAPQGVKLYDNEILCATCHDPHLNQPGNLRIANQQSALCLSCHAI